ncbi:Uncharacterized protein FKW44_018082, partial [Caligus rogercresseyi]
NPPVKPPANPGGNPNSPASITPPKRYFNNPMYEAMGSIESQAEAVAATGNIPTVELDDESTQGRSSKTPQTEEDPRQRTHFHIGNWIPHPRTMEKTLKRLVVEEGGDSQC